MKVAYDISILGLGYINPKARTGVFRVVEALLLEIVAKMNVDIVAIALNQKSSIWDELNAFLYLEQGDPKLRECFDSCYNSKLNLNNFYLAITLLQRSLLQLSVQHHPLLYKFAQAIKIPFNLVAKYDASLKIIQKTDLYHSYYFPLPPTEVLGKIPRILTIYDLIPILFTNLVPKRVHYQFIETLNSIDFNKDWVICISQQTKNDFCQYTAMNPARVFVTPLAANTNFYPINDPIIINAIFKKYNIPNSRYFLSIATLEPRKNLSFLIRCFCKIVTENPQLELSLVLVGVSGWKNKNIFEIVKKHPHLQSRIIFTGYIPDSDLSAIYSGAIAFVYPSLYEGFGLPPLEAMQCGIPVITSNTSSLPEVVGNAGITIDPKQSDELCQAMLDVVNNSKLRAQMSLLSLEQASKFSWKKCAEQTVEVYNIAANN